MQKPCLTPLPINIVTVLLREFEVRGAVVEKTSQEAADKIRQFSLLDHRKDPGMIDAGIGSLKDVVRHLPERNASL